MGAVISTAFAVFIVGGIAFLWIARTLKSLANAPALAKRPLSKFVVAFFLFWGVEGLAIGTAIVLRGAAVILVGAGNSLHLASLGAGMTFWIGGLVLSALAGLFLPATSTVA